MNKVKILSLDGGGLRGIIQLLVLKELERIHNRPIHELFDVITGTSTGGIIACGLTYTKDGVNPALTLDQLIDLYTTKGDEIFPRKTNIFSKTISGINSIFNPKFSAKGLDRLLTQYFSESTLRDTLKPVIVTSYDIKNNEVIMFKSRLASVGQEYNAKLREVCRATSAAPTYLPTYRMNFKNTERILVDGGICINNPAMAAVADVLKSMPEVNINDIECLSIGTGIYSKSLGIKTTGWGMVNWVKPITSIMMQASAKTVTYECDEILQKHLRLQVTIDDENKSDMADSRPETLKYLIERVNSQILSDRTTLNNLKNFFN
jgi:patatin-like phospholipase/acyl hydrolase